VTTTEHAGPAFGPNSWLVDEMYARYLADPASVSESWQEFFSDYRQAPQTFERSAARQLFEIRQGSDHENERLLGHLARGALRSVESRARTPS
jgi:2-oxoglutarate dehydrogenase complex dehydrogenase (E1) component-like enzyme